MNEDSSRNIPEGGAFLDLSARHQDTCAAKSRELLQHLPQPAQRTYENLGTLLSLLDRMASCYWGCHGKEHVIEDLVGRAVGASRAALRLIEFGHYDEALALARGIAEIGNLMWLFYIKPDELRDWIDLPEKDRRSRYSPLGVRKAIEAAGSIVPHDQSDYAWLCMIAVHPTPNVRPQAHNHHGIPTLGGVYQEDGQIECLTRLAWVLASVAGPAAKLALIERPRTEVIVEASIRVVEELPDSENEDKVSQSSEDILKKSKWLDRALRNKNEAS
jgi:hypothetical protein